MKDELIVIPKPLDTDSIITLLFKAREKRQKSRGCLGQQSHQQLMDALTDIGEKGKQAEHNTHLQDAVCKEQGKKALR